MLNKFVLPSIFVGSLLLSVVVAEIPLGSKLSVLGNEFWVSSNGDFALGFFNHSDQPNQYSVGIYFHSNSIPVDKQAVVWVAGAEVTVSNLSYFELTKEGDLVLFDSSKGGIIWTTNTSDKSVSYAALLDDGNFVLVNEDNEMVWQSFNTPSDTLLPGQNLSTHLTLRAAKTNLVSSYYTLYMSDSGQLQLKWETSIIYWVNGRPLNETVRASLKSNGFFQLLDERSSPVWSAFAEDHDENVKFRFLRLDVDGNLRIYSWDEALLSWKPVWQAVENQCDVFATCGTRGICGFTNSSLPVCKCPFRSTMESNLECLAPYGHSCDSRVSMVTYKHTSLYGIYPPNDSIATTSLDQCWSLCEKDPLCTAVTYSNDGRAQCRIKKTQYFTGYSNPSLTSISFVKICLDPLAVLPNKSPPSPSRSLSRHFSEYNRSYRLGARCLTIAALGSFCIFFVLQVAVGLWIYRTRSIAARKQASSSYAGSNNAGMVKWTFSEIKELTENFKHQLGPNSFKARIQNNQPQPVIVKQLKTPAEERRFRAMVSVVGSIHHKNLVKLEGYCCESGHRFLVYEFLKNGSLEESLKDPKLCKRLTWKKRMAICLSVAKAIFYLHTECREFVSHGNLKCGNVILDENLEAKVTEFGFGKLDIDTSYTADKDVEDFGKLVLVLITGCQQVEDLREWSYNKWISGYGWRVVDKSIEGELDFEELERVFRIAYWCLQADERMRPSMGEVVNVLEGTTLTVDLPPPPFSCYKRTPEEELMESKLELEG